MNGTMETAALWIFDPVDDPALAVFKMFITHFRQIDEVIKGVHDRMKRADKKSR